MRVCFFKKAMAFRKNLLELKRAQFYQALGLFRFRAWTGIEPLKIGLLRLNIAKEINIGKFTVSSLKGIS